MASITIRNLADSLKAQLRLRAAQHNCSMEEVTPKKKINAQSNRGRKVSNHHSGHVRFTSLIYLDQTGVALTLNQIQHELAISNSSINWIVNAYLLALAVLILLRGRLGDIFGHKKVFMTDMGLFLISSFLCGIAESGTFLILSRTTLQGIGRALVIPNNKVLIAKNVKPEVRGKAIGTTMSLASIFLALGPTIGGLITNYLH